MSGGPVSTDDPTVVVYRVVDATELSYLLAHGHYGSNPSQSGKYFALTLDGARAFANVTDERGNHHHDDHAAAICREPRRQIQ
jgi:hypothetical protein